MYLRPKHTHCPDCDTYLSDMKVETGCLCQLVVICSNCNEQIPVKTTEEVLG